MSEVISFLGKGGFVVYPLLLCSVVGLAVIIEKSLSLRRKKVIIPEIVNVIKNIRGPEDVGLAASICEHHRGSFANIVKAGLEFRHLKREEIKEVLTDQGRQEVHRLERGLVILETIAAIAPLLGLLGTVIGILKVFHVISEVGVGQASAMAGGISEALITTIIGLSIGIPAVVAYNWLSNKAEAMVLEIEKHSSMLLKTVAVFSNQSGEGGHAIQGK